MNMERRIGFIIDGIRPGWKSFIRGQCPIRGMLLGCRSESAIGVMRYQWIADRINSEQDNGFRYELFRPYRNYKAIVFLKSMGSSCLQLVEESKRKGVKTVFDTNVDYFTEARGTFYYEGMAPTEQQRVDAIAMASACDGAIGDSSFLAKKSRFYNKNVQWIPDNIPIEWVPRPVSKRPPASRISLLWSGEAVKLFELLHIEKVLVEYARYIDLTLVTNSMSAVDRWYPGYKERINTLLGKVEHRVIKYRSIRSLLDIYNQGGFIISPRCLNNTYNMGHTEWKITLGMACGRIAICSPVPSYLDVARRAGGRGIRICKSLTEWAAVFDSILSGKIDIQGEEAAARRVVKEYYSTDIVAGQHLSFMRKIINLGT